MNKIIHIDMDAYFAAIEIREDPSLRGKCVIVGGNPNGRGVVSTCSYEARKFGVHSGMSSHQAWKLCPQGIFLRCRFKLYKEVSEQIRAVFFSYTDLVETMSLDEAYLDVTTNKAGLDDPVEIARRIKADILAATQLTCSAGVSFNKFLAKIGSELEKPDGLSVITPEKAQEILFNLPIGKFYGVGRVTAARMKKMGIHTGEDLHRQELRDLTRVFGKMGLYFYQVVRGIDNRAVITESDPKSISCENTFHTDLSSIEELLEELKDLVDRLVNRLAFRNIQARNLILKIKYDNFECVTRSCPLPEVSSEKALLFEYAQKLLVTNWDRGRKIRLLGVGVGKLDLGESDGSEQLELPV
ncbi:MAG TPA: DNA polymerase IV [Candidatus Syntrophosphaera sp.]|nr:DNA polymerase IV [Candidatus Cloacimonadota bacterium]HOH48131.1 DNA polymerase IV [Candidatus Syntrophosphaera sp.]HPX66514.1 DNA polymerase IV [Candidatus Syntrophosphaera sp.]HQP26829.1 DNA polymerase IV [Candidatus Syntrophosphaera sp.]HRQ67180.1 DNA polymerase IV [Candidatus Syntrophosphaera sp.]